MDLDSSSLDAIGSSVAAILAWFAKLRWSHDYKTATEERIKLAEDRVKFTEEQVKVLADFTPDRIKAHFETLRGVDKERVQFFVEQLTKAKEEIIERDKKIAELQQQSRVNADEVEKLKLANKEAKDQIEYLERQVGKIQKRERKVESVLDYIQEEDFPMNTVQTILGGYEARKNMALSGFTQSMQASAVEKQIAQQALYKKLAEPAKQ